MAITAGLVYRRGSTLLKIAGQSFDDLAFALIDLAQGKVKDREGWLLRQLAFDHVETKNSRSEAPAEKGPRQTSGSRQVAWVHGVESGDVRKQLFAPPLNVERRPAAIVRDFYASLNSRVSVLEDCPQMLQASGLRLPNLAECLLALMKVVSTLYDEQGDERSRRTDRLRPRRRFLCPEKTPYGLRRTSDPDQRQQPSGAKRGHHPIPRLHADYAATAELA